MPVERFVRRRRMRHSSRTYSFYRLLIQHVLAEREPMTAGQIAQATNMTISAAHNALSAGRRHGNIVRQKGSWNGSGRRAWYFARSIEAFQVPDVLDALVTERRGDIPRVDQDSCGRVGEWLPVEAVFHGERHELEDVYRRNDGRQLYGIDRYGWCWQFKRHEYIKGVDQMSNPYEETPHLRRWTDWSRSQ